MIMQLYCLDNSDAACRSEDYPCGNRLAWQLTVIRTISRSLLAPKQGQDSRDTASADDIPSLAVVSSAGRPALSVAPTSDAAALLGLDIACHNGERCQFLGSLRLALLAAKRSSSARVLAFLASPADLPPEQCRQLSASFASARVPLDVVLLAPAEELQQQQQQLAALQMLTETKRYPPPADSSSGNGTAATATAAALVPGQQQQQQGRPGQQRRWAAGVGVGGQSAGGAGGEGQEEVHGGGGRQQQQQQRLFLWPPPSPSLALWQQLEPLLEELQLEGAGKAAAHAESGEDEERDQGQEKQSHEQHEQGARTATPNRLPSQPSTSPSSAVPPAMSTGRPPLPRPPRHRSGGTPSALPSNPLRAPSHRPLGGLGGPPVSSGPLPSRSRAARGGLASSGSCRYESLDSLQHLSLDGFLRSWLPSYANVARVLQPPQPSSSSSAADARSGSASGASGSASAASGGAALGPGRLCYISVYRLQLPRWHRLLEVHAGRMNEVTLPQGSTPPQGSAPPTSTPSPAASEPLPACKNPKEDGPNSGKTDETAVTTDSSSPVVLPPPSPPAPSRPVVPRAPCPVQVQFSTRCSSAAAAASASAAAAATSSSDSSSSCHWVCPDLRRGSLSLVASVEDPGVVKLLWSERPSKAEAAAAAAAAAQRYGSIFAAAEEADGEGEGGVDPAAAELELTLSPTRTQFRFVPHARGGGVLEVSSPRSVVLRPELRKTPPPPPTPPPPHSDQAVADQAQCGAAAATAAAAVGSSEGLRNGGGDARAGATTAAAVGSSDAALLHDILHPRTAQGQQPFEQPQKRYFFWLQQEWKGEEEEEEGEEQGKEEEGEEAEGEEGQGAKDGRSDGGECSSRAAKEAGAPGSTLKGPDEGSCALAAAATAGALATTGGNGNSSSSTTGLNGIPTAAPRLAASCRLLAERLQALLECPPEFDPGRHKGRVRCSSTPLQLGPLPFALVEEIMRASGRELSADGTVTLALPTSSSTAASTSANSSYRRSPSPSLRNSGYRSLAAAGAAGGHTASRNASDRDRDRGRSLRMPRSIPSAFRMITENDAAGGSGSGGGDNGGSSHLQLDASTRRRSEEGAVGGGAAGATRDDGGGAALTSSPLGHARSQVGQPYGRSHRHEDEGAAGAGFAGGCGGTRHADGDRSGSAGMSTAPLAAAVSPSVQATERANGSRRPDVVRGFSRTTYSRIGPGEAAQRVLPSQQHQQPTPVAAASATAAAPSSAATAVLTAAAAVAKVDSHPLLDDSDWGSEDSDDGVSEPATTRSETGTGETGPASPEEPGSPPLPLPRGDSARPESAASRGAAAIGKGGSVPTASGSGSGASRAVAGGDAAPEAATAAAAAAAAAALAAAAVVDAEAAGGGSRTADDTTSLMFELD